MLIWAVVQSGGGGAYNPQSNAWRSLSSRGAPAPAPGADEPFYYATAIWDGQEMLIWGSPGNSPIYPPGDQTPGESGTGPQPTGTGAGYSPATDSWTPISQEGAPAVREGFSAVWDGQEMLMWGGWTDTLPTSTAFPSQGGAYDPATDSWRPLSVAGAPAGRSNPAGAWDGRQFIVFGPPPTGAVYDPVGDAWAAAASNGAPSLPVNPGQGEPEPQAAWTGNQMAMWGAPGSLAGQPMSWQSSGLFLYDPFGDQWTEASPVGAPSPRIEPIIAWTGQQVLVWGGWQVAGEAATWPQDGALYTPCTGEAGTEPGRGAAAPSGDFPLPSK